MSWFVVILCIETIMTVTSRQMSRTHSVTNIYYSYNAL